MWFVYHFDISIILHIVLFFYWTTPNFLCSTFLWIVYSELQLPFFPLYLYFPCWYSTSLISYTMFHVLFCSFCVILFICFAHSYISTFLCYFMFLCVILPHHCCKFFWLFHLPHFELHFLTLIVVMSFLLCLLSILPLPSPCPNPHLTAKGGVIKSLEDMGAVVTNLALGTTRCLGSHRASPKKKSSTTEKEDTLVMDTKLKIIEILEVRLPREYNG